MAETNISQQKIVGGFGGEFKGVNPVTGERRGHMKSAMGDWTGRNSQHGMQLSRAEAESQAHGIKCYIYNISPIFQHERRLDKFGIFLIPKAPSVGDIIMDHETGEQRHATAKDVKGAYKLSAPIVINNSYVRPKTTMIEGQIGHYVEYGEDIAEDIVGSSKRYPADLVKGKDLTKKGVFICYGKRFEECEPDEQRTLLQAADAGHREICRKMVIKGDQLYDRAKITGKGGPLEMHRQCAVFLGLGDRAWVTQRGSVYDKEEAEMKDCIFCFSSIRKEAVICPVCTKTVDAKKLAALEKGAA